MLLAGVVLGGIPSPSLVILDRFLLILFVFFYTSEVDVTYVCDTFDVAFFRPLFPVKSGIQLTPVRFGGLSSVTQ